MSWLLKPLAEIAGRIAKATPAIFAYFSGRRAAKAKAQRRARKRADKARDDQTRKDRRYEALAGDAHLVDSVKRLRQQGDNNTE